MNTDFEFLARVERLLGASALQEVTQKRVIVFGVGGVGSWCVESLVRSGIQKITIVDSDCVCVSNLNRQLMATTRTVGLAKVDVLKERLLQINPSAEIDARKAVYSAETAESFKLDEYDYIIDAIDSLKDKAHLILTACKTKAKFFSSMGAALKLDPTKIQVAEFWKVQGCPLARALRTKFRSMHILPAKKFKCVFSEELLQNQGGTDESDPRKAQINGALSHITAIYGFTIAGLVIQDIVSQTK
ncbi:MULTISPECIES: tRNA threonylcarbamoyladenosine dehydratase [Hallerella]|uniref:tRNA threonylcarbamoyladenosine dehydratase n=1 Tax=Hallerella TaxID=2815788 RepID=UPI002587A6AB|nr:MULTISPECIES: tRNA threonylcarbamoyladenosine dehydratase [Hallerella]MCI6874579.1 tRNA threonylcarbamoyladenosine dehydratase [Hallerella sp.]MDY5028720.1 tRNA threonylcarbamoyladenosine dehydratase [Hallerella succinigenes]